MTIKIRILNTDDVPDSHGETFDHAGVEIPFEEVLICKDFSDKLDDVLGKARLVKVEGGVDAYLDFIGEVPVGAYPAIGGVTLQREGNLLRQVQLDMVGVSMSRNCDHRIEALKKE